MIAPPDSGKAPTGRSVGNEPIPVQMEGDRRPSLCQDGLVPTMGEAAHAEADAVLGDALAVPVIDVPSGFLEYSLKRTRDAHVQVGPRLPDGRHNVPGESFAGRRRPFGYREKLGTILRRTSSLEETRVRTAVDGFVIDDPELADLEGLGQKADRP